MSSDIKPNILGALNDCVDTLASNISDYTKKPGDFTRNRKLNAATAIKVTLNMQGNSLKAELLSAFPNLEDRMTASAYEQAKGKLTPEMFVHLFHEFNKTMENPRLFNGRYRLFAIDGSDFNMPWNPESQYVVDIPSGRPKKDGTPVKPYCQVHANLMFDLMNRTYQDCILQPRSKMNERDAAIDMIKGLDCGKFIVIMDRGYDGFNMIENCNRMQDCYYVIRTKAGKGGIKEIEQLPDKECDREMEFTVTTSSHYYYAWKDEVPHLKLINHHYKQYKETRSPKTKDQRWDFGVKCKVKFRVVKFRINDVDSGKEQWEVMITNLNRFEFPVSRMKELYHMRWDIETSFRELKYALGGVQFHSKKDDFIQMELLAHLIMFNAVSRSIACTSVPQVNHKHEYSVDFKMACLVVRKYYRLHNNEPPDRMFTEIESYINPIRPGRSDKRNLKPKTAVWFLYRVA